MTDTKLYSILKIGTIFLSLIFCFYSYYILFIPYISNIISTSNSVYIKLLIQLPLFLILVLLHIWTPIGTV